MKKENRKLAQAKRAAQRKKKEQIRKIKKFLTYFIPSAAVIVLVAVLVVDSAQNTKASEKSKEETPVEDTSKESEQDTEPTLSKDSSLTIKDGDKVNIDYVGSVDGVEFEGGNTHGNGTDLVIGSHSYIDDFEEQLIGAHPGDQIDVSVTFPEDYGQENLDGKDALFKVTVNGIYEE